MDDKELQIRLKANLEKIPGISNVRLHEGIFRGENQKPAYLEYHLASSDSEGNSARIYSILRDRIMTVFPNIRIEYTKPDTNGANLRRINIDFNMPLKPNEKEQIIKSLAHEFNHIIENYLLRKK